MKHKYSSILSRYGYLLLRLERFLVKNSETRLRKVIKNAISEGWLRPIYLFTIHKSGSHLLQNLMKEMGFRRVYRSESLQMDDLALASGRSFFRSHVPPPNGIRNLCLGGDAKIVLSMRDPRDVALSTLDYFDPNRKETAFPHVNFIRASIRSMNLSRIELMRRILDRQVLGDYPYQIEKQFIDAVPFYFSPNVHVVRFENLLPSGENRSLDGAIVEGKELVTYLDYPYLQEETVNDQLMRRALDSKSATRNRGQPFRWKTEGDRDLVNLIENRLAWAIELFGYGDV